MPAWFTTVRLVACSPSIANVTASPGIDSTAKLVSLRGDSVNG